MIFSITKDLTKSANKFNSIHWNIETGYDSLNSTNFTVFPYRTFDTGKFGAFKVVLKMIHQNRDFLCSGPIEGFIYTFHSPVGKLLLITCLILRHFYSFF